MNKKFLIISSIYLYLNFFCTALLASSDTVIKIDPSKIKEGVSKIFSGEVPKLEIALRGKKLSNFFENNNLNLNFDGKNKEYKFKDRKYEVFIKEKLEERGNWKIHGLTKGSIKLNPENGSQSYYFKKIINKEIIYLYDKVPGSQDVNKTLVNIDPLEKKEEPKKQIIKKEEPKEEKSKKVVKKEEPKKEEPKKEEPKVEEPKKVVKVKERKVPESKKRIYKYICDPTKSEYYWGKTKDNMKLSRYEDAPYEKYQSSRGYGQLEGSGMSWSVTEIDFYEGYIYMSGSIRYDANSNGKLDTMPIANRWKIKSHDKSRGIYIMESEYNIPDEIVMEIKYTKNSLESMSENVWLAQMGEGPRYWEKSSSNCIQTEYLVDKNSGEKLIKVYSKQKPIVKKAERDLYASDVQDAYQAQTNSMFEEVNQKVLNEISIADEQYKVFQKILIKINPYKMKVRNS